MAYLNLGESRIVNRLFYIGGPVEVAVDEWFLDAESESSPTVTTESVSVYNEQATGRGTLATGGGASSYGFVYSTSSKSAPGDVAPGSSGYEKFVSTTAAITEVPFTQKLIGLHRAKTYYVRAFVHNTVGYAYGNEVTLSTVGWHVRLGVIGDSGTDSYRADDNRGGTYAAVSLNLVEILARLRRDQFYFGEWGIYGEPRRTDYAYNWSRSEATYGSVHAGGGAGSIISLGLHTGATADVAAGKTDSVIIRCGANDFAQWNGTYEEIYDGTIAGTDLTDKINSMIANITTTLDGLVAAGCDRIVIYDELDYGPFWTATFPNATFRLRVTNAINTFNAALYALVATYGGKVVTFYESNSEALNNALYPITAEQITVYGVTFSIYASGDEPHYGILADGHWGTIMGSVYDNIYVIDCLNQLGESIPRLTDYEVVLATGLTGPTAGIIDNFNRGDGAIGANYTAYIGGYNVASNRIVGTSATWNVVSRNTGSYGPDCDIFMTISTMGANGDTVLVGLRDNGTRAYELEYTPGAGTGTLNLYRLWDGVYTKIGANYTKQLVAGDKLWLRAEGNYLTSFFYDSTLGLWTNIHAIDISNDGLKITAAGGLYFGSYGTTAVLDDFGGGTYTSGVAWVTQDNQTLSGSGTVSGGGSGATGTAAITQDSQTLSAIGAVLVKATAAITQDNQTVVGTGKVTVKGTAGITQTDQTLSATGLVTVKGTAAITQADQTVSGTGLVTVKATASITQDNQTLSATGGVLIKASAAITQADQTVSGTGGVLVKGTAAITQADETLSASGTVTAAGSATGTAAITQDDQTLSATGKVEVKGTSAVTQADETLTATGKVEVRGTSAITQTDETLSATGGVLIKGTAAITQADETLSASGTVSGGSGAIGTANITQADQTLSAIGDTLPVPTPAERIYSVLAENRIYEIQADGRIYGIEAEQRVRLMDPDMRGIRIDQEIRIREVV